MRNIGWNLALALAWCALQGRLSIVNLLVGYAIGFALLGWLLLRARGRTYVRRLPRLIGFIFVYLFDVIVSSLRIAWEVVSPVPRRKPQLIEVPLDVETDVEIALLANLVTFTPGTVAVDVDEGRMLVHDMFVEDADQAVARIKRRYEHWVRRLLR